MKILHIYNTAGVASIIAKNMDNVYCTESTVITPLLADPYGFTTYGKVYDEGLLKFKIRCLLKSVRFDVIHCHSTDGIGRIIKKLLHRKILVVHYHGSDIRNKWKTKQKYYRNADIILVSTKDLLVNAPARTVYVGDPVDTELFFPTLTIKDHKALHFSYGADKKALDLAKKLGVKLKIIHRFRTPIKYSSMPKLLGCFEYYIDVKKKDGHVLESLSKTGLEALSCGLKVVNWKGEILDKLPPLHNPYFSIKKIYDLYLKALK